MHGFDFEFSDDFGCFRNVIWKILRVSSAFFLFIIDFEGKLKLLKLNFPEALTRL